MAMCPDGDEALAACSAGMELELAQILEVPK